METTIPFDPNAIYDSTGTKRITKANSIQENDEDGHGYCIHEDDAELFSTVCARGYESDDFEEFEKLFGNNMTGGDYNWFRKEHLK